MSTTPKRLSSGQITTTTLTSGYTVPVGSNTRFSQIAFTNTGGTATTIDIYHNDGTDRLKKTITLPGGSGKERIYWGMQRVIGNAGDVIKFQSSVAVTFNYFIYGSEIEV